MAEAEGDAAEQVAAVPEAAEADAEAEEGAADAEAEAKEAHHGGG